MKNGRLILIAAAVASLAGPRTVLAHHGQVEYGSKTVTLKGTVTKFEWSNPHCILSVAVKNDRNTTDEWFAEILPPSQMVRAGWTRDGIKAGDQVTLVGRPGKKGEHIMWLEYLVMPDGRKLSRSADRNMEAH